MLASQTSHVTLSNKRGMVNDFLNTHNFDEFIGEINVFLINNQAKGTIYLQYCSVVSGVRGCQFQ